MASATQGVTPVNNNADLEWVFGQFRLNPRARSLVRAGQPVAIPGKVFDALLLLVESHGAIVSKETLMDTLWPDTEVEESNLTQSIFVLRKLLGDTPHKREYIATVHGRGYSFVAPVERVDRKGHTESVGWSPSLLSFGVVGLLILIISLSSRNPNRVPPSPIPVTSLPGGEYEPAFSPDGTRIAFVWNGGGENYDIYTCSLDCITPLRLTSDQAQEGSPAWSPDGKRVAFFRYSSADAGYYIVPAEGGEALRAAPAVQVSHIFDRHVDWSPDGTRLAVADRRPADKLSAIFIVSLKDGSRIQLTEPPRESLGDTGPLFSHDGASISFRRTVSSSVNDIYTVPTTGGPAVRITSDNSFIPGHAWSPDGKDHLFLSNRGGRQGLWRVPKAGGQPVAEQRFGEDAHFLGSSRLGMIAFSQLSTDTDIVQIQIAGGGVTMAQTVAPSTRDDSSPQLSPDGRRIAFRSDRSGFKEIWVSGADGSSPTQLTNFGGPLTGTPRWSPDSSQIVFDSRPAGRSDIYAIPASGGTPRRITTHDADDVVPSWSRDGRWIYFASNRTGRWELWKTPSQGSDTASVQMTKNGGFAGFEARDGDVYYAKGHSDAGLWRITPEGVETPVLPDYPSGYWGHWGLNESGLFWMEREPDGSVIRTLDFSTRQIRDLARLSDAPLFSDAGFAVGANSSQFFYAKRIRNGSDIMLVKGIR